MTGPAADTERETLAGGDAGAVHGNPRAPAGHTLDFEPGRVSYLGEVVGWLSAMVGPVR